MDNEETIKRYIIFKEKCIEEKLFNIDEIIKLYKMKLELERSI